MLDKERAKKIILYIMGIITDMKNKGIQFNSDLNLTEDGIKEYKKLISDNFKPTENEITQCLEYLNIKENINLKFSKN